MWPNLFLVGVAKAGTTTLHRLLESHPSICMSTVKEPHFFTENIRDMGIRDTHTSLIKDESEYLGLFEQCEETQYRGESSPSYFWDEGAATRIKEKSPDSKIIVVLRDPIARAFSHYHMEYQAEREKSRSFYKALKEDARRENKGWGISRLYVELGHYADSLKHFYEVFGRENVLVLFFESAFSDLIETMAKVQTFLNLKPFPTMKAEVTNRGSYVGELGKFLKYIPLRQLVPPQLRHKVKNWASVKDLKPKPDEIEFLVDSYRQSLISLDRELGINYYTRYFETHYNVYIANN